MNDGLKRTKTELKTCPHCGGPGELVRDEPIPGAGFVECHDCGARGGISRPDEAVRLWNTRAERTCKFVSSRDPHRPPACSACGHELDLYECEWFEDGTYGYGGNYCPHCGAKVVGSDEAKEV